jgi:diadenosine tetraphosphate (Ap4A) HIT family hydrolase
MNATLRRFGYPGSVIAEYAHWVVMVRPLQPTLGCTIIAVKSDSFSLGDLSPEEAAELPLAIRDFEQAVRRIAAASKFNYLALMMVDPNPHFHAIPRYAVEVQAGGSLFVDAAYPNPPDLHRAHELTAKQLDELRRLLADNWRV